MAGASETEASTSRTTQIRFGGLGGQGIVLAGRLLGTAAALYDGKEAVCTQTYGPEARGGASRSDVVISDEPVDYPFVIQADVLAVLFQEAYLKFRDALRPGGLLMIDTELVQPVDGDRFSGLPATRLAEGLGNRLATNVVMLGYLVGKTRVVGRASLEKAIRRSVKQRLVDLDLQALEAGIGFAESEAAR